MVLINIGVYQNALNMRQNWVRSGLRVSYCLLVDESIYVFWRHSGFTRVHLECSKVLSFKYFAVPTILDTTSALRINQVCLRRMDQPVLITQITVLLVRLSVYWKCLHWWWNGILWYFMCTLRQEQNSYDDFPHRSNGTNISHSANYVKYILFNVHWRVCIPHRLNNW